MPEIWYDEENTLEDMRDQLPKDLFQDEWGLTLPPREEPIYEDDLVNPDDWDDDRLDEYYQEVRDQALSEEEDSIDRFRELWFGKGGWNPK